VEVQKRFHKIRWVLYKKGIGRKEKNLEGKKGRSRKLPLKTYLLKGGKNKCREGAGPAQQCKGEKPGEQG